MVVGQYLCNNNIFLFVIGTHGCMPTFLISRKKKIMSSSDINQVHMMKEIATFDDQINNDKKADEINSNKNYLNENNKSEFISYNLSGLEK